MLQSFFTGLSGMFSFSKSLDNVSNNVANMNTPGYRGTDTFLRSVNSDQGQGFGTNLEGTSTRVTNGEIRQTGNDTDLAITGRGFFVLRDDSGELTYTRAGQFRFNEDNELIDSVTDANVMAINEAGALEAINITNDRIRPAVASSEVSLTGNLSPSDTTHTIEDIRVFDAQGNTQTLSLILTNDSATTPDTWSVSIRDTGDTEIGTGTFGFNAAIGSPLDALNQFTSTLTFNGVDQDVTFSLGEADLFSGGTQFENVPTSLAASVEDGNGVLGLSSVTFDGKGIIQFNYSNGDSEEGQQIALANFADESKLTLTAGSIYRTNDSMPAEFGRPDNMGFGNIQGGSIELSNVDLTQEFADILIVQRGYQASSQIMSVSNELIEQLYNSTRG